jgi:hypothetical protein
MHKLSPTAAEIYKLQEEAPKGGIVMINLLKFRADGGREAYRRYLEAAGEAVRSRGGNRPRLLYAGIVGDDFGDGEDWDFLMLAEYDDYNHYVETMMDPLYQTEAVPIRPEALEKTLFMVSYPADRSAIWNQPDSSSTAQ